MFMRLFLSDIVQGSSIMRMRLFLSDIVRCFISIPRVKLPWWFPEEDGGEDDFPVERFPSLQTAGADLVAAFKNWLHDNHPKPYKFVGLLLSSDTSSFEKEVKDYCLSHQHMLSMESGDDFLYWHKSLLSSIQYILNGI